MGWTSTTFLHSCAFYAVACCFQTKAKKGETESTWTKWGKRSTEGDKMVQIGPSGSNKGQIGPTYHQVKVLRGQIYMGQCPIGPKSHGTKVPLSQSHIGPKSHWAKVTSGHSILVPQSHGPQVPWSQVPWFQSPMVQKQMVPKPMVLKSHGAKVP